MLALLRYTIHIVCARLSPPPALALSLSLLIFSLGTIIHTQKESKEAKEQLANATREIWRAFSFDLVFGKSVVADLLAHDAIFKQQR